MITLGRTIRFAINPAPEPDQPLLRGANGYAGVPAMRGLGRHYELDVVCRGPVDPATGYFKNIKDIDSAARTAAVPIIARACAERPEVEPMAVLAECLDPLNRALGGSLRGVRWRLSPYYAVEMTTAEPSVALLRQRFEFAASHRLHTPTLSDAENRRVFGKCNNPAGHGHNYVVEPCVAVRLGGPAFTLVDLEAITARLVIDRFDHKHLNAELPEFGCGSDVGGGGVGLNPSVENIAKVCHDLLAPEIARAGAELRCVTVWETEKTSAVYPG